MQNAAMRRLGGFTLIELLVVVLIIGILASVAIPQYEVAVKKSRLSAALPLVKTLADAEEVYFIAHGVYTAKISNLDVDMPAGCTLAGISTDDGYVITPNGVIVDLLSGIADVGAGSGSAVVDAYLRDRNSSIRYRQYLQHSSLPSERHCVGNEKVCKSMGGTLLGGDTYKLP